MKADITGAQRSCVAKQSDVDLVVAQVQWASGGGKMENDTAQSLRSGAEHNYQFAKIGMVVRRLTPVECSRLQGFSDNWNEWGVDENGVVVQMSDSSRYKQFGNAVTVNVAEWLANVIKKVLEEQPCSQSLTR